MYAHTATLTPVSYTHLRVFGGAGYRYGFGAHGQTVSVQSYHAHLAVGKLYEHSTEYGLGLSLIHISFKSAMTYEILLIVVIGGIGSVTGSVLASFLFIACSEWWLRFLDAETYIGAFKVPLLRAGFRKVVFSIIIMAVVLFYRQGIMGDRELNFDRILPLNQAHA